MIPTVILKTGISPTLRLLHVINSNKAVISDSTIRVKNIEGVSRMTPPFKLDSDATKALLIENMSLFGFSLNDVKIIQDSDNLRKVNLNMEVPDIQTANNGIQSFVNSLMGEVRLLNLRQNTQIAIYQINLKTSSGELLFNYVNDILLESLISWQCDALTKDWCPHPPSAK
jgi:hypothetical protein